MNPTLWLVLAIPLLLVAAAPVQAGVPAMPPSNLTGTYDNTTNTAVLSWSPPDSAQTYTYAVYRGDTLLGTVADLTFTDSAPSHANLYAVRAIDGNGQEGMAAFRVLHTFCEPVIVETFLIPPTPPYVWWGIREECLPIDP